MTAGPISQSRSKITDPFVLLFSLTLFLSASLTFTIQPMVGKLLLPLVGGAPSGWLVTMVYFQIALLCGYAIAHVLARLTIVKHVAVIIALLFIGLLMFPLHLKSTIIDSSGLPEAVGVLLTLTLGLTLPCIALFTLSPTLQRLFFAESSGTSPRDPYFLFAASNFGSLGGLLAYPIVIEHISGLSMQVFSWQIAYGILIALCLICLACSWKQISRLHETAKPITAPPVAWRTRGRWLVLAFIPSSLMLGVTSHVTSDLGAVPFFWVLPLALYLLTFILAFAQQQAFNISRIGYIQTAAIAAAMAFFIRAPALVSAPEQMFLPVVAFFVTALFCHGTLALERPDSQRLTEFYLWLAIGGALGGFFNTFIAPFVFPLPIEFMFVMLLSCLIHPPRLLLKDPKIQRLVIAACIIAVVPALVGAADALRDHWIASKVVGMILLAALAVMSISPRTLMIFSFIAGLFAISIHDSNLLTVHRDFFGVIRVFDDQDRANNMVVRKFFHGSTLHGLEKVQPEIDTTPHSYYEGPLTAIINLRQPQDVGLIGLGAGVVLCYQAPDRHYTVYELDPAVPVVANQWFDYMKTCGMPTMVIGDGRRTMAKMDVKHDLLIVDAFTSDAIPMQLLTKEAFQIYLDHMKPDGVLAIHISNRFYDLCQPISNVANSLGLHGLYVTFIQPPGNLLGMSSRWVVIARDASQLEPLRSQKWKDLPAPEGPVWTDDFSDVLSALSIFQPDPKVTNAQTH